MFAVYDARGKLGGRIVLYPNGTVQAPKSKGTYDLEGDSLNIHLGRNDFQLKRTGTGFSSQGLDFCQGPPAVAAAYHGYYGNHLFQYMFARIVACYYGYPLLADPPKGGCLEFKPYVPRITTTNYQKDCLLRDADVESPFQDDARWIYLDGYFQWSKLFNDRPLILSFLESRTAVSNYEDIVMHVRVGDYKKHKGGSVIHPEWYLSILKKQKFRKLFIVVREDDAKYLDWYISHFSAFRPTIVSSDIKHDFNFIMQFDRIICSNSTFCWWAAFLSEARTIWTFEPWLGDGARLALFDRAVPSKGDFVSNPFKPLGVFDKAYLINLDIRQDRWQKASQRMRDVGIEAERFVVSVPKDKGTFATPGKRGCSETHLNIVKEAKKRGYDSILILEDDVVFHPKFKEIWAKVWRNVSYSSWDILYFYDWSARQTGHEAFQDNSPEIREIKGTTATHCYAIRKSGYDAIIAALEGEYAKGNGLVVDTVLKRMAGVRKVAIFPQLAAQDSDFSNLTNCQRETRGASWI